MIALGCIIPAKTYEMQGVSEREKLFPPWDLLEALVLFSGTSWCKDMSSRNCSSHFDFGEESLDLSEPHHMEHENKTNYE